MAKKTNTINDVYWTRRDFGAEFSRVAEFLYDPSRAQECQKFFRDFYTAGARKMNLTDQEREQMDERALQMAEEILTQALEAMQNNLAEKQREAETSHLSRSINTTVDSISLGPTEKSKRVKELCADFLKQYEDNEKIQAKVCQLESRALEAIADQKEQAKKEREQEKELTKSDALQTSLEEALKGATSGKKRKKPEAESASNDIDRWERDLAKATDPKEREKIKRMIEAYKKPTALYEEWG